MSTKKYFKYVLHCESDDQGSRIIYCVLLNPNTLTELNEA